MIPVARHLVESTLFAGIIAVLSWASRRNAARTRHCLWMAASVKFLVPFALLVLLSGSIPWRTAPVTPLAELTFVMADAGTPATVVSQSARPVRTDWWPQVLWGIWLCGSVAIAARWWVRWRRVAAVVREGNRSLTVAARYAARNAGGVKVLASPTDMEPGVFGIFRPVLVLPAGIEERLSEAQLQAVIAHELCHLRHRDNLAATIQMVVELLFWFHPLVWWLGARLVEERELACDEEVLLQGSDPETYARSLLTVCEFCLESPLACVAGITGADLKRRIEGIMTARTAEPLRPVKKLLLGALATAAVAVPLGIGLMRPAQMRAQAPLETAKPLHFDVASVKPLEQSWLQIAPQRVGGRIRWQTNLSYMLTYAYRLQPWRISGTLPGNDRIYAVDATTDAAATEDQVRLMFQSLLADRFKMVVHRETRDVDGYALTVARGGVKLKAVTDEDPPAPWPKWFEKDPPTGLEGKVAATIPEAGAGAITGRRVTMPQLTEALQRVLRVSVIDQTGLPGKFYFAIEFAQGEPSGDSDLPSVLSAVQDQLGLKLEKHKGPVEVLVVDHIEKVPTEN